MVKVKVCGITNLEDALLAQKAGADALGFVFYKKSLRYISPKRCAEIIRELSLRIKKIGVFVNERKERIKKIAKLCHLDMLQLHGDESPKFCNNFKNYKIIKAFGIKKELDLKEILKYRVFAYLFDTLDEKRFGGTGRVFNWDLLKERHLLKRPIFLSGGLNERNVLKAIEKVKPNWIDASSSLESNPRKKDYHKVKKFIKIVKRNKI